jgi:hypothetical protein
VSFLTILLCPMPGDTGRWVEDVKKIPVTSNAALYSTAAGAYLLAAGLLLSGRVALSHDQWILAVFLILIGVPMGLFSTYFLSALFTYASEQMWPIVVARLTLAAALVALPEALYRISK